MAKKLTEEDLVLNVIVNGSQSKREMGELSRFIKDTSKEVDSLKNKQKALEDQGKQNTKGYKQLTEEIRKKSESVQQARDKMVRLVESLKVANLTSSELKATAAALRKAMDNSVPGSEKWNTYKMKLEEVDKRIREVRASTEESNSVFERLATGAKKYWAIAAAGIASITAFAMKAKGAAEEFADLDDTMSTVMKTTGQAKDEVEAMSEELSKIKTRTTQDELLGLARIAGKLGVSKNEVEGFARAADQIVVALNEDLGGDVEETVNKVGKLVDIFKLKGQFGLEEALIRTGSAINDLGAAGTANEGYLVEFANRVAGTAPSYNISMQNVLGLAATLDSLGQSSEVAATTFANVIPDMFRNTGIYAKVAGVDLKSFTELLNTDVNEAFIRVLDGIKGNNAGMSDMVKRLDDLGVDGARSVSVLGALANNTQALREQQDISNKSFADGTSIANEYNTMNASAKAKLEMSRKELQKYTVAMGKEFYPILEASNTVLILFVRLLTTMISFLVSNRKAITVLVATIITYNVVVAISNALSKEGIVLRTSEIALAKLKVFWDNAMTAGMHLLSAAYALSRGQIAAAKAEMIAFNAVTKMNPLGLLLAAIIAVGTALVLYSQRLSNAEKIQRSINSIKLEANKSVQEEKTRIEALMTVINNEHTARAKKLVAIKNLRDIMPDLLRGYKDEEVLAGKASNAVRGYIEAKLSQARADKAIARMSEIDSRQSELTSKSHAGWDSLSGWEQTKFKFRTGASGDFARKRFYDEIIKEKEELNEERQKIYKAFESDLTTQTKTTITPTQTDSGKYESEKDRKAREAAAKKAAAEQKKRIAEQLKQENIAYEARLKAAGLFNRSRAGMTTDELEKLALLEKEHFSNIEQINKTGNSVALNQNSQALAEMERRQLAEQKYRNGLINPMNELVEQENQANEQRLKNAGVFGLSKAELEQKLIDATTAGNAKEIELLHSKINAIESIEGIHQAKLNTIDAKAIKDRIDKRQSEFQTGLAEMKSQHNLELAEISTLALAKSSLRESLSPVELEQVRTLAQAKRLLQRKNQEEETAFAKKHMEELLQVLKNTAASGKMDGINLSDTVLSKEEKEELEKRILEVKAALAELKNPQGGANEDDARRKSLDKVDILGFSASDWDDLFSNLESGKLSIDNVAQAAQGLINAWSMYNQFVAAGEKKQLQEFTTNTNKKKQALKKQLDSGQISQEEYASQVEKLDAELDNKKAQFERNQAKREKNVAMMNAVVNTAAAVAKALPNIPLSIAVGAMGAAQIALIAAQPLPEVPGLETGGSFGVTRSQDKKKFNAKYSPGTRGYIDSPTVLVGENGREFVVNADGVNNPTIAPILSILDTAQRSGSISTLNLEKILVDTYPAQRISMPNRKSGGAFGYDPDPISSSDGLTSEEYQVLLKVLEKLDNRLDSPLRAEVVLLGKKGLIQKTKELNELIDQNTL